LGGHSGISDVHSAYISDVGLEAPTPTLGTDKRRANSGQRDIVRSSFATVIRAIVTVAYFQ
jgi:hypothetical protein